MKTATEPNFTSTEFAAALRPLPRKRRAKPKGAQAGRRRARWAPGRASRRAGAGLASNRGISLPLAPPRRLASGRCLLPAGAQEKGRCGVAPEEGQTRRPQGSERRGSAHEAETLPAFSKPYSAFFCSSSRCCLLCRHTEHLKDRDVTTLPAGADTQRGHGTAGTLL